MNAPALGACLHVAPSRLVALGLGTMLSYTKQSTPFFACEVTMRHLLLPPTQRVCSTWLLLTLLISVGWPQTGVAKKPKAPPAAAAPPAAVAPEPAAPPAAAPAPAPTPAPPLAAPVPANNLGADNAKDLDPAVDPQWTISDRRPQNRPQQFALSLGVWPPTSVSASIWYAIPVLPNGLIPSINDSFDIELGAVIAGYFDGLDHGAVIPAVGGRWNFHVTRNFIPFVTLKLDMQFGFGPGDPNLVGVDLSLGTLLRVSDWAYMRFELGYPQGLAVGVSFPIGG